ncbi:DUF2508 family protein [Cohnella fermenti]|uniref:DUF2508 family protein n=1 Tax=Cohnella fermenti TaxID=2565925 RepID=A0A4S4C2M5_9BACL|nr:DUF2508 family protein [Cohnella fermenti]THF81769.1 DUF2508 family protein [Cohnella fermenti]
MLGRTSKRKRSSADEARAQLREEIRQARKEREVAQCLFENAMEFERIDHAIYTLEAAEKRLDILLREAKQVWGDSGEDGYSMQRVSL